MYAPGRDLAYLFAPAMKEVFMGLDEANWTAPMREYLTQHGIAEEQIGLAASCLANSVQYLVNVRDIADTHEALVRAGWYEHPLVVRQVIFARLGEVMAGGFLLALRDVSAYADESSQNRQISDMVAAGRHILSKSITPATATDVDQVLSLQAELENVRTALKASLDERDRLSQMVVGMPESIRNIIAGVLIQLTSQSIWQRLWLMFWASPTQLANVANREMTVMTERVKHGKEKGKQEAAQDAKS